MQQISFDIHKWILSKTPEDTTAAQALLKGAKYYFGKIYMAKYCNVHLKKHKTSRKESKKNVELRLWVKKYTY